MDKVSDLMGKILAKRGLKDQAHASYAVYIATTWISEHLPNVSNQLHPRRLEHGILLIESDHSIASQELRNCSEELLGFLNSHEDLSVSAVSIVLSSCSK